MLVTITSVRPPDYRLVSNTDFYSTGTVIEHIFDDVVAVENVLCRLRFWQLLRYGIVETD